MLNSTVGSRRTRVTSQLLAPALLCVVGLSACGAGTGAASVAASADGHFSSGAAGGRAMRSTAASKASNLLYVSDTLLDEILVFPASEHAQSAPPLATISLPAEPQGLWVDRTGVLYAVVGTSVEEFAPGASAPFLTLTSGLHDPIAVAVDSNLTVYVNDQEGTNVGIVEYPAGSSTPSLTVSLTVPNTIFAFSGGLTFDGAGNLYATAFFYNQPPAHVYRIAPGATKAVDLGLIGVGTEAGLGSDAAGNLYAGNETDDINVYAPGHSEPRRVIEIGTQGPSLFAVTRKGGLYVPYQARAFGTLLEFSARGRTLANTLSGNFFKQPFGAALAAEAF
jgi:sugar lactone lactonase YvrE